MSIASFKNQASMIVGLVFTVAIGMVVLGSLGATTGITTAANTSINTSITALGTYASWIGIIILIGIAVYVGKQMK